MGRSLFWEKLDDLRFREIEGRIFKAYFVEGLRSVSEIARFSGISRSTMFRHHETILRIRDDYYEYIIYRFREEVCKKQAAKDFRCLVFMFLTFMIRYKVLFRVLFRDGAEELALKMMREVRVYLEDCFIELKNELVFKVFCYEMYVVLEDWIGRDLPDEEMSLVYRKVQYLAQTANRLAGLK